MKHRSRKYYKNGNATKITYKELNDFMSINKNKIKNSVYLLYLENKVVYIGLSTDLKRRLNNHRVSKIFDKIKVMNFDSEADMFVVEIYLINKLKPALNTQNLSNQKVNCNLEYKPNSIIILDKTSRRTLYECYEIIRIVRIKKHEPMILNN